MYSAHPALALAYQSSHRLSSFPLETHSLLLLETRAMSSEILRFVGASTFPGVVVCIAASSSLRG